jgi:sporulation protein YlmC with PRC-barrel domain
MFVGFHLLDRQIVDRDGQLVGKVDEVELSDEDPPRVVALLLGPRPLGERMGGWLGRLIADVTTRLHSEGGPYRARIPYEHVAAIDSEIHLRVRRELLPEPALEEWLREHVIGRIPGSSDA